MSGPGRPTGWCSPRRWSSTARAATSAPTHGAVSPPAAVASRRWTPGEFDNHCPTCGEALGWELVDESARLDPRSSLRRRARSPRSTTRPRGRGRRGAARDRAEVPQRLRTRDAPGHAVLRRRGDLPLVAGARRGAAGLRGRRARCATSCTSPTSPGPTSPPSRTVVRPARPARSTAYNVCSGSPVSILDVARIVARPADREPEVTGQYRAGDVRHVVASPARATAELGFTAEVTPEQGLAEFAHRAAARLTRRESLTSPSRAGAGRRGRRRPGAPRPAAAPPLGQQGAADQQPRHERQPDPLDLGPAHLREVGGQTTMAAPRRPASSTTPVPRRRAVAPRRAQRAGDAGADERTRAEREGGEVAPHPVLRRPVVGRRRPSSARAARGSASHQANPNGTYAEHDRRGAAERRRHQRPPRPRNHEHRHREHPQQGQAVGHHHARTRAAARRRRTSRSLRRTAATASAHIPQAADGGEHRVGRHALPDRGRAEHQERRGRRACARRRAPCSVCSTATAVEAATSVTTSPAASPLPSPSRTSTTKKVQRARWVAAMCTGQLAGGVVPGSG